MNTKPRLVDPSWFAKPIPKPRPRPKIVKKVIPTEINNSLIINIIGLCILVIGGLCIYQRYIDRDNTELDKNNKIIELNEYVKRNIK
tara:strand:+ start:474 stop:734 length:261 start_codon:yes stop_codon:yes gene_type:complete